MSDKGSGNDQSQGTDSCKYYEDLAETISEQRDECTNSGCAAAVDFSASAAYFKAASCYSSK